MKTLAKVAIGVAVAKGVSSMMKKGSSGGGGLLGGASTEAGGASQGGGLEELLGSALGGKPGAAQAGGTSGGLGGLLEQLGAGAQGGGQSGGLGGLLGGLAGGAGGGGLGDLLGGLASKAQQPSSGDGGSFGDLLNSSLRNQGEPDAEPTPDQEAAAGLMLRAMIQATKCDGEIDIAEQKKLLKNLGDISPEEEAFIDHEIEQPVDVQGLVAQVPAGLEQQVYTMSVLAIDLDSQAEAQYLHNLAEAMGINQAQVNALHDHLGVPHLYS